jgi:hypothetical protein
MYDKFKIPNWSAKNPLGIIALFISLIYGMSASLFGFSVKELSGFDRTVLVLFIVFFPFTVLAVFTWLVANHHKKLYGPKDFQSDEGFLAADVDSDPKQLGERLAKEVADDEYIDDEGANEIGEDESSQIRETDLNLELDDYAKVAIRESEDDETSAARRTRMVARAYIAESLTIQELQTELGGTVQREVRIGKIGNSRSRVDGLIHTNSGTAVIEIKVIRSRHHAAFLVRRAEEQAYKLMDTLTSEDITKWRIIVALVIDNENKDIEPIIRQIQNIKRTIPEQIEIRIFYFKELLEKYGFL